MGKYINVNLDNLSDAMAQIDTYRNERDALIVRMTSHVHSLPSSWQGQDCTVYISEWDSLLETDGILERTDRQLSAYHDVLETAYDAYKKAQKESVQKAESITSGTFC